MKKLLALLLALMMVFALVACGNNEDNSSGNTDNPGVSQNGDNGDEGNNDGEETDWTAGFNLPGLTAPEGSTATFPNQYDKENVVLKKDGGFTEADVDAFAEQVWNLCMQISPDGIYMSKYNSDGSVGIGDSYAAVTDCKGNFTGSYSWSYTDANGDIISVHIEPTGSDLKFSVAKNYDLS